MGPWSTAKGGGRASVEGCRLDQYVDIRLVVCRLRQAVSLLHLVGDIYHA